MLADSAGFRIGGIDAYARCNFYLKLNVDRIWTDLLHPGSNDPQDALGGLCNSQDFFHIVGTWRFAQHEPKIITEHTYGINGNNGGNDNGFLWC